MNKVSKKDLSSIFSTEGKIRSAVEQHDQCHDKKQKVKFREGVKSALYTYCNDVIVLLANGDIHADPYGFVYGSNLKHDWMVYDIVACLYELRDVNEGNQMADAVDNVMVKAVEDGHMDNWYLILSKGTYAVVSNEYVKLVVNGVETAVEWTKKTFDGLIQWLKNKWEELTTPAGKQATT